MRVVTALVLSASVVAVGACGGSAPQSESQQAAPASTEASHSGGHAGKVFFMQPADGAMVKSPVVFVFGNEQVSISPVPPGEIKEVRPGMAHYHLGVDTDCLPAGQVIPKAQPWIHFGDGKNTIEMQLMPGPHKFALQAGDDLHATVAGLCQTISITVTE